ncbi:MAG: hypothetical protein ACR2PQ_00150 [Myxococcota bacterium]
MRIAIAMRREAAADVGKGGFEERHIGLVQVVLTKPGPGAGPVWSETGGGI